MASTITGWGPIDLTSGSQALQADFSGRELKFKSDNSTAAETFYSETIDVPLGIGTTAVWNPSALAAADTSDVTISWCGTNDASVLGSFASTGWTEVAIMTLTGSGDAKVKVSVILNAVANVIECKYVRFKFVTATANVGDFDIPFRLQLIPEHTTITNSKRIDAAS